MRKYVFFMLISLLLAGCAAEETFETVADEWVQSVAAPARDVNLTLPEDAAAPVSAGEKGVLYQCAGYEIMVETLSSGDLEATLREVTGYSRENLTVLETRTGDVKRYDMVWTCLGEQGQQLCRGCILDDGNYHYVLTVLAEAERAGEYEEIWNELFSGYSLS